MEVSGPFERRFRLPVVVDPASIRAHVRKRIPRDPARQAAAALLRRAVGARGWSVMERLPILPLGQLVVYPHVVLPLSLTDPKAVQLIDEIIQGEKRLLLGVVKSMGGMEPPEGAVMNTLPHQLYDVGTLGTIVRMLKLGDGSVRVMVQGLERARLANIAQGEKWLMADSEALQENLLEDARTEALKRTVMRFRASSTSRRISAPSCTKCWPASRKRGSSPIHRRESRSRLAGESRAARDRRRHAAPGAAGEFLVQELQVLESERRSRKVNNRLDQTQREYVLREQL
jgi:ATP-dependent Lon protease